MSFYLSIHLYICRRRATSTDATGLGVCYFVRLYMHMQFLCTGKTALSLSPLSSLELSDTRVYTPQV